jgi:hypothetical protein
VLSQKIRQESQKATLHRRFSMPLATDNDDSP